MEEKRACAPFQLSTEDGIRTSRRHNLQSQNWFLLAAADAERIDITLPIHPMSLSDVFDFNDFLQLAEGAVDEHRESGGSFSRGEAIYERNTATLKVLGHADRDALW